MTAPQNIPATASRKPRSNFNNWISAIGGVIATGALFSFALLTWMDLTGKHGNPYLGILTYLVAPAFLIAGLALVFLGAWAQRRWAIKHAATTPDKWRLDFNDKSTRRYIVLLGGGAVGFIILSAFGSYQTYHYAESTQFCGQVCHEAMNPEFSTYQRGGHARVDCVGCHVGSGAQAFIQAKINGTHQLIAYTLNNYNRPIETPVKNLRPARETCERCHWPEKFLGNIDVTYDHTLSNKNNTPYSVRLLLRVNNGRPGTPLTGIHWHVSPDSTVEYFAGDEKRQTIPWMRVTNRKTGTTEVYRTEEYKSDPPADQIRVMDCIDCHNRPAHNFPTINDAVEHSIALGKLSTKLPYIKRTAVQAMLQKEIITSADAPAKIAEFITKKYKDSPELQATIGEIQKIYSETIFPERKADWRVYPNNIGHKNWPGCFRCHDDKHKTTAGLAVRASDCTSCHTILAQGKGEELNSLSAVGQEFKHPGGALDGELSCSDCHNGGLQQ